MRDQDISHGRLAWKRLRLQSEEQLGDTSVGFLRSAVELAAQTPTIESAAKESASTKTTSIGGRSVARAATAREPEGNWTTGFRLKSSSLQRTIGQVNASYTASFHLVLKKYLSTKAMVEKPSLKYKQQVGVYMNVYGSESLPQRID